MRALIKDLGAMRLLLLGMVALCLPMAAFADVEPEGFGVITVYIAPALSVLLLFVLLLDALMSRVFAIDLATEERQPARTRMRADLLAVLAICLAWGPFYYGLLLL